MNILKEYIREIVKDFINEQASPRIPRLPTIPTATGGGAVPDSDTNRINAARVKFAETTIGLLNNYYTQLNQIVRTYSAYMSNPNVFQNVLAINRNLNGIVDQIIATLENDTDNWKRPPENVPEMDSLEPYDSALRSVKDATDWVKSSTAPTDLQQKLSETLSNLPEVINGLQAYMAHYQQ